MSKLIINADDFGYSTAVNYGIIHAHQRGILTSTTIMANMPGFEEAVELAKENTELGIGMHLTLTCGSPLRNDVPSLVTDDGIFHNLSFYEQDFKIDLEELYKEWKTQIEEVYSSGIQPTHLDSHHHVNSIEPLTEVFIQLAKEYNLPVRHNFDVPEGVETTARFYTTFDSIGLTKEIWKPMEIRNLIEDVHTYGSVEVMCHPAYVDQFLMSNSSFNVNRVVALNELIDERYPNIFVENEVELIHFGKLNKVVK